MWRKIGNVTWFKRQQDRKAGREMFVKVIRGNPRPQNQVIFETKKLEFLRVGNDFIGEEIPEGAIELIRMDVKGVCDEHVFLFKNDEVYLSSNDGRTIDSWRI